MTLSLLKSLFQKTLRTKTALPVHYRSQKTLHSIQSETDFFQGVFVNWNRMVHAKKEPLLL